MNLHIKCALNNRDLADNFFLNKLIIIFYYFYFDEWNDG